MRRHVFGLAALAVCASATLAVAQQTPPGLPTPRVNHSFPAGLKAGTSVEVTVVGNDLDDPTGLFLKGEADMVLSYTTSPAYHAIAENKPNYGYAEFREGFYPQIEIAGILKSSPHQDLARQFLAWLATPEAQAIIPTTNWMYPVVALGDKLPAAFPAHPQKILSLPEDQITAEKSAWIDEALAALR